MNRPSESLDVARRLFKPDATLRSTDAELRRAISSVYYAVVHTIFRAAAQRFVGPGQELTGAYALLSRSFDHRHITAVCQALRVSALPERVQRHLRRQAVSQSVRDFVNIFP